MKIKITCDSAADLTKEQIEKNNIAIIPFAITMGDKEYRDGVDLFPKMIFEYVAENKVLPKTAAINAYEYEEFFKEQLQDHDAIIHFSISSKVSSTIVNAEKAAEKLGNVFVIDSQSLSSGISLQLLYACELREQGLSAEEIVQKVEDRRKHVQAGFILDKIDYLHKGGRCSSLQLLGANLLKIRPSIVLRNGKMQMNKKFIGNLTKVQKNYLEDTIKEFNTPDNTRVFLTYSSATPEMVEMFKNFLQERTKFKEVHEVHASATITSHCGENTIGILYYNDGEEKLN